MDYIESIMPQLTDYAIRIAGVFAVLVIGWWIAGKVRTQVRKGAAKSKVDETLAAFLGNVARWVVILLTLLACLSIFGIETTSFAAVLGAAGLAIGLAFQGSLSNLAAGIMLQIFRPFQLGDVVSVGGQTGGVKELGLFTTSLDTVDNRRIIVPNSIIFGSTIENITFHEKRRVDVNVGTDYGASVEETRSILEAAAAKVSKRLEDEPAVAVLTALGDSSVNWQVRIWCKTEDYFGVLEEGTETVKRALDDAGIGIPYPTVDVNLSQAA